MNRIRIMRGQQELAAASAEGETLLYYRDTYQPGDTLEFESTSQHVWVGIDHTIRPARLYLPTRKWTFLLPLEGDLPQGYPPFAFQGGDHLLSLTEATGNEYRNLACNPADQRRESSAYPHVSANVETRDESVFFARNTVDGIHIASSHGRWPWLCWGIGGRADATIHLDFGRPVSVDKIVLYLRADFKRSGYWVQGTVRLSDGFEKTFPLEVFDGPQEISLDGFHTVTWAQLDHLIKTEDQPSPYPSLRQWEIYGRDAE